MASICDGAVCVLALFVCGPLLLSLLGSFLSFLQGSASLVGSSMSLAAVVVSVLRCLVSLPGSLLLSLLQSTRADSSSDGGGGGLSTGFSFVMMALLIPLLFLFLIHWISLFSSGGGTSGDDDGFRLGLAVVTFLLVFALYTLL